MIGETGRDRGHTGQAGRHTALPDVAAVAKPVRATAPGDYGAVALQRQAMESAGGDRGHAGEAGRHAALTEVGELVHTGVAAPGDNGAVSLQRQAVVRAGGNRGHRREAIRHAAFTRTAAGTAPRDHASSCRQGQIVVSAGRDRGHTGQPDRSVARSNHAAASAAPSDDRAVAFNARLWYEPAAIAVTPASPSGTVHCPKSLPPPQPQATTVPLTAPCVAAGARSSPVPRRARTRSRCRTRPRLEASILVSFRELGGARTLLRDAARAARPCIVLPAGAEYKGLGSAASSRARSPGHLRCAGAVKG